MITILSASQAIARSSGSDISQPFYGRGVQYNVDMRCYVAYSVITASKFEKADRYCNLFRGIVDGCELREIILVEMGVLSFTSYLAP